MRTYIHEHDCWPQLQWSGDELSVLLGRVRYKQGMLLGRMGTLGFALRDEASLTSLTSDVVKSSAIEGESLDMAEVRSSIARRLGMDVGGLPVAGRDVDGVVEMMLDATQRFSSPLTTERLFGWHASLFLTGWNAMARITVGQWRSAESGKMQVVSGPVGRESVHFEAPASDRLDGEMVRFLQWFNADDPVDPVLKAGVAHLWFVTVHPFDDGNGRTARAIADMALARADGTAYRFYSMSAQIAAERKEYYLELERAQRGNLDITPWLTWFLGCLERAIDGAYAALDGVLRKAALWERVNAHPVNDRQRAVINRMLSDFQGHLSTSKYAKLTKCSSDTALRDVRELVARHVLVRNPGSGRSTSYRLGEPDGIVGPDAT